MRNINQLPIICVLTTYCTCNFLVYKLALPLIEPPKQGSSFILKGVEALAPTSIYLLGIDSEGCLPFPKTCTKHYYVKGTEHAKFSYLKWLVSIVNQSDMTTELVES